MNRHLLCLTPFPWKSIPEHPDSPDGYQLIQPEKPEPNTLAIARVYRGKTFGKVLAASPIMLGNLLFVEERLTKSGYPEGPVLHALRSAILSATG